MKNFKLILSVAAIFGLVVAGSYSAHGAVNLGNLFQLSLENEGAMPTCNALREGAMARAAGGNDGGTVVTRMCVCQSDGAAAPTFAWCSLTWAGASTVVCTGGSATVCP